MTYSVYQHWDPLEVCIVGRSYSPEFYHYIENIKVREVFERIARETEEDYQKLITLLESFGVDVVRPNVGDNYLDYINHRGTVRPPPMTPRDYTLMLGDKFYHIKLDRLLHESWDQYKAPDWPESFPTDMNNLPDGLTQDMIIAKFNEFERMKPHNTHNTWQPVFDKVTPTLLSADHHDTWVRIRDMNGANWTRIGTDLYIGNAPDDPPEKQIDERSRAWFDDNLPQYRVHMVNSQGHVDGAFCPVKPGLIISLYDISNFAETFPNWEVVYLPDQSWAQVHPFLDLKKKNQGKWWVPGEELNDDFTDFVNQWMDNWVGYVEESVFDVNMLVIDEQNVVCNNYNKDVFDAFERHGVTPHIVNFRHRYFWDGGLHCITSDISRRGGVMKDYFPERNK